MVCHPPRVQSPVITAMWTTGVGTELELTQSSHLSTVHIASQADITQHQLLPTRQNCKEESREISQISYRTLSLRLSQSSLFPSLSQHSFDV